MLEGAGGIKPPTLINNNKAKYCPTAFKTTLENFPDF